MFKIGEIDFQDSVMTLGFSEELNKLLLQVCKVYLFLVKFVDSVILSFYIAENI